MAAQLKKTTILLMLCFCLLFPDFALAQEASLTGPALGRTLKTQTLRVGMALLAPLAMLDKNNALVGLEVDVARRLADDLGARLELTQSPMPELIDGLYAGRYDMIISGYSITPERALRVNFSTPYYYTHIRLLASKQAAPGKSAAYFNSAGVTIGVVVGHSELNVAQKNFPLASIRLFSNETALLADLLAGKIAAAVVSDQLIRFNVAFHTNKLYLPAEENLSTEPVAIALRKGDYESLNFINNWISILAGEGWVEARKAFWYEQSSWIKDVPDI